MVLCIVQSIAGWVVLLGSLMSGKRCSYYTIYTWCDLPSGQPIFWLWSTSTLLWLCFYMPFFSWWFIFFFQFYISLLDGIYILRNYICVLSRKSKIALPLQWSLRCRTYNNGHRKKILTDICWAALRNFRNVNDGFLEWYLDKLNCSWSRSIG